MREENNAHPRKYTVDESSKEEHCEQLKKMESHPKKKDKGDPMPISNLP